MTYKTRQGKVRQDMTLGKTKQNGECFAFFCLVGKGGREGRGGGEGGERQDKARDD